MNLKKVGEDPYVGETLQQSLSKWLTPNDSFYVRSHFDFPKISKNEFELVIDGLVDHPISLKLDDLKKLPKKTLSATLECAGNNRSDLSPAVPGNQFSNGAVSNAIWSGVSLRDVLNLVNLKDSVLQILFQGADSGETEKDKAHEPYLRSLSRDMAFDPDTLLAYEMNGEDLPIEHGFPLRLVVPGWYGMASVKWLTKISAIDSPFKGYFQGKKYVLKYTDGTQKPLEEIQVKSLITYPEDNSSIDQKKISIQGIAWSGRNSIESVEVSLDSGQTWNKAELVGPSEKYSWRHWQYLWNVPSDGEYTIMSIAKDTFGNNQPIESVWNELGYAVNGSKPVNITVE